MSDSETRSWTIRCINRSYFKMLGIESPLPLLWSKNPSNSPQDRISALPDHILHHILSFLPMEFLVQTSILSKRWHNLWKYTPIVDFYFFGSPYQIIDNDSITRCLQNHQAPKITRFSMVSIVDFHGQHSQPNVRQWVSFALLKQVKVLKLGLLEMDGMYFAMPDLLYKKDRTHSLEKLYLTSINFSPRRSLKFSGFISLKVLTLNYCKVSNETFEVLISRCLALEVLTVDCCEGLVNVKISGPNLRLKRFDFRHGDLRSIASLFGQGVTLEVVDVPSLQCLKYWGELTKIHLKNLPNLLQVSLISQDKEINDTNIGHLRTLINEVAQVVVLGVNSWFLQFIAKEHQMRDSSTTAFQKIEQFVWYGQLMSENDVFNLIGLLGNCPSLEVIRIDFRKNLWDGFCDVVMEDFKEPEFFGMDTGQEEVQVPCLEQLKCVQVLSFSGFKGEMELMKRLLEKAVALATMHVYWRCPPWFISQNELQIVYHLDSEVAKKLQKESIEEQVSHFPKASSHCQVLFE